MIQYKNRHTLRFCAVALLFGALSTACKKYENPAQIFEEYGEITQKAERKVLLISIDGATGAEVKKVNPPTIAEMLKNSKYTFNGVSDIRTNNGSTWASMLSGVSSTKHEIANEQFVRENTGDEHGAITNYPTFLSRILDVRPEYKSVSITTNSELHRFLIHADHRMLLANDALVRDSAVKTLEAENANVFVVNFRDVLTAGTTFGFSADIPEYKAAIQKTDTYIAELMAALKKRKNYAKEEWLVIVNSNHGGTGKVYGGNTAQERNIFSIFYNPNFKALEMDVKPFYGVRLYGKGDDAAIVAAGGVVKANAPDPSGLYNPGNGSMTVEAKVLFNKNAAGNYTYNVPPFLSKTANRSGSTAGWSFFRNGTGITFYVANGVTNVQPFVGGVGIDGRWHTIAATIARAGSEYRINVFVDGIKATAETTIADAATSLVTSPADLVMGYHPTVFSGGYIDMYMADVKIWNRVLPDAALKSNISIADVPTTDPYYTSLVGYWPANDGGSNLFRNKATVANAPNFNITGNYRWDLLASAIPDSYAPSNPDFVLLQNIDVATQLYYWLRVPVKSDWGLDSEAWLSAFEREFIK